ncbi:MAG: hypothetical protein J7M03_05105 [Candidatus Desulfofervidaceae bacterium]|nr:hypothetical protein [Candidatus Desulfofervidaceae bacterium]
MLVKTKFFWSRLAILSLLALLLDFTNMACKSAPLVYVNKPALQKIQKVAVFPFANASKEPHAGEIVTQIFFTELVKTHQFQVEEMGNIMDFFIKQRIEQKDKIDKTRLTLLRNQFKVDAVFLGTVREFEEKGTIPIVEISLRLIETQTDQVIWRGSIERTGEDYVTIINIGRIRSLNKLTQYAVRELLKTTQK